MVQSPTRIAADRPRVPWLSRIGRDGTGQVNEAGQVLRGMVAVLAVLNPITSLVTVGALLALSRTKVRGRWLALVGTGALLVAWSTGLVALYLRPWTDLATAVVDAVTARSADPISAAASAWPAWLLGQVPVAIAAAAVITGTVLGYWHRYRATWRETDPAPTDEQLTATAQTIRDHDLSALAGDADPTDPTPPAGWHTRTARWLARAVRWLRRRPADTTADGPVRVDDVTVRLGVDLDTAGVVSVPVRSLRMHTVIGGPTGSGKSTTLQRLVWDLTMARTEHPIPTLLIDMKADPGMVQFFQDLAERAHRRLHLVTVDPATSTTYASLRNGDASQMRSRLIGAEETSAIGGFTEPHYRVMGERFLLICAKVLDDLTYAGAADTFDGERRPWRKDVRDLVSLMNVPTLAAQADRLSPTVARDLRGYLNEVKANERLEADIYGLYGRFALWCEGPAGDILTDAPGGLDLYDAIDTGDLILFSLDSAMDQATARQIGNVALQDIVYCMAQHGRAGFARDRFAMFGVDEFSALGGTQLGNLYSRVRSAGGGVMLASQSLFGDLEAVSPEFCSQVIKNANVTILHQQAGDDAARWAESIGTEVGWTETVQVTDDVTVFGMQSAASGVGSLRQTDSFLVHPNELRTLGVGQTITVVRHPTSTVTRTAITPPPDLAPTTPGSVTSPWLAAAGATRETDAEQVDPAPAEDVDPAPGEQADHVPAEPGDDDTPPEVMPADL